jgi:transposase
MDRAAWHTTSKLEISEQMTLIFLPPVSPELNPMEQVWRQLREDALANRCYKDYEAIVEASSQAWNELASNREGIKSLCSRSWAIL